MRILVTLVMCEGPLVLDVQHLKYSRRGGFVQPLFSGNETVQPAGLWQRTKSARKVVE